VRPSVIGARQGVGGATDAASLREIVIGLA
jgi:hypothetical protein